MAEFYLPVAGISAQDLADTFGADRSGGRSHRGIDIFADTGTAAVAVRGGTVVKAGDSGGLGGLRVWVKDDQGYFHYYAHLSSIDVKDGQRVDAGQRLGGVGQTGNAQSTPPHLHYSVNRSSSTSESASINPYTFLTGEDAQAVQPGVNDRRARPTENIDVEEAPEGAAQEMTFAESRRMQSDTMASIMESISRAASQTGGKVLDTRALFGDVFADGEEPEQIDEEVA
jgi:murein DD-endopeptidase MepM/ murein hydrolase activator NlpD